MIVDASVAAKWLLTEDDNAPALDLLSRSDLRAPDLLIVEVANVLWKARRRGYLTDEAVLDGVEKLPTFFAGFVPITVLAKQAARLSIDLDHPIYDCLYLAAAIAEDDRMVTADKRLLGKLQGSVHESRVIALGATA